MVRHARRQRRIVDGGLTDWIVVRNRLALLSSRNKKLVGECLDRLGLRLGFRPTEGFSERVVFREFFPRGLTALDNLDETTLGQRPNLSHLTARAGGAALMEALKLPIDERGRRRAAARAEWAAAQDRPLDIDDLIGDEPARDTTAIAPRPSRCHFMAGKVGISRQEPEMASERDKTTDDDTVRERGKTRRAAPSPRAEIDAFI